MELIEVIKKRRSVRQFTDYYVNDDEIKDILYAAHLAPSWANTQVWNFIVVRDREIIKEVTDTYSETNPARKCSYDASVLILCSAKINVSGYKNNEPRTEFLEWFLFDLGLAIQNLSLKVCELGLGSVIVGSMDHKKCGKILGIPDDYKVVASIPIGKPEDPDKIGPKKKELKDIVFLNKYGETFGKIY